MLAGGAPPKTQEKGSIALANKKNEEFNSKLEYQSLPSLLEIWVKPHISPVYTQMYNIYNFHCLWCEGDVSDQEYFIFLTEVL